MGGVLIWDEDVDVIEESSVICDLGLLEGVTGVTLQVWEVVVIWDEVLESRLG